jgi:carboxymethylenebutenolidase
MYWDQRTLSSFVGRPLSLGRLVIVLVAFALPGAPVGAETVKQSTRSFKVEGETIAVECFTPSGDGRHPAVLLLHGSEGRKDALFYRCAAGILARHGYVALIVHYFDRTGTKRIDPADISDKLFGAWMGAVRQAVLHAAKLPEVDGQRIGLLGFSLGAYLSLAVAAQADLAIAAVADFFGGLPEKLRKKVKSLPPTLIVHGDADKTVPVEEALALEKLLQENKCVYEKKIYAGQDHLFKGDRFGADVRNARERTLAFFGRYLRPQHVARGP